MEQKNKTWRQQLAKYEQLCRAKQPVASRQSLSGAEKIHSQIIAGGLAVQLQNLLHQPDHNRQAIFTSARPGLTAASKILVEQPLSFTSLYPDEYRQWIHMHPDKNFRLHIHLWSHVVESLHIDKDLYSLDRNEQYWLHTEGMLCGHKFGRGAEHLWKWDGRKAALLKKNHTQWIS